ncbi:MAG: NYN domain-containing protein [Dehalococcoidia bacterium]|nr:MAG: NYN domain-containing protein [Dehalococcoidia bacterium]
MKTNVYIDGFNLFMGCLKGSPHKWLDLDALSIALFPTHEIHRIRYFTAPVVAFPHNADAPTNQLVYLRALATLKTVTIHKDGWFASHPVTLPQHPLTYPSGTSSGPKLVRVLKMEEKRTDVDIATHLLVDCFEDGFEQAVVISNDSDLATPISVVKNKFRKPVIVVNPHRRWKVSKHLVQAASNHLRAINPSVLRRCQFPPSLADSVGSFTKPTTW